MVQKELRCGQLMNLEAKYYIDTALQQCILVYVDCLSSGIVLLEEIILLLFFQLGWRIESCNQRGTYGWY